ncbi:MAG: hypothetical protein ACP5PV_09750 [Methanothrix sp.]
MKRILSILLLCFLMQSVNIVLAEEVDLSGSWSSEYQLGSEEEALTANIQQVESNLLGSFTVKSSSGDEYSGVIFGTVDGSRVAANLISVGDSGNNKDPLLTVTLINCRIKDKNTLKGTYAVQDSGMNAIEEQPFEATRN